MTASPRRFCVHTGFPRGGSVLFKWQHCEAAGAWRGSLRPFAVLMCCEAALWDCWVLRVSVSRAVWRWGPVCFLGKRQAACAYCLIAVGAMDVPQSTKPATPTQLSTALPFHHRARSCRAAVSELKCFLLLHLSRGCFQSLPADQPQPTFLLYPPP